MDGRAACTALVVPCFNERLRLRADELRVLADDRRTALVLVDDGSTDGTADVLEGLAASHPDIEVLAFPQNQGKGEAVRIGLRHAITQGFGWVGYADADLATPASELLRLGELARSSAHIDVTIASRVALLGHDIRRSPFRHYTGRVFATAASLVLAAPVYDTQCGAKVFRVTSPLERAVAERFSSRWAFDVELLGRLQRFGTPLEAFWEEPLLQWHDAPGSRRTLSASVRSTAELSRIWWSLRRAA
jgi:dolichyl-phosphate beta-glucosyltransferase